MGAHRTSRVAAAITAVTLVAALPAPGDVVPTVLAPDAVPDRGPVLSEPIARGDIVVSPATTERVRPKDIDGDPRDWIGEPARIGGASVWGSGEHIHTDFLFDAHGADDGGDRDRLDQFADLLYLEERTWRVDQMLRTSGSQLGVPEPVGAPDEYGDVKDGLEVADLTEVRWAAHPSGRRLSLLARVGVLTDPTQLGVLVLADGLDDSDGPRDVGLGTDLTTSRFDRAVLLTTDGAHGRDLVVDTPLDVSRADVAVSDAGWDNLLEAGLPTSLLATTADHTGRLDVAVVAGRVEVDGSFTPLNAAYRHAEPLEIWNDRLQALDLLDGTVDRFSSGPLAVADLAGGRTQPMDRLGPGYHERQMRSAEAISREQGRNGVWQPYGV